MQAIEVNTHTLTARRVELPVALIGLDVETLRNLQTAIDPVPPDFVGVEYWPSVYVEPAYDPATQKLGDEILLPPDAATKTVPTTREVTQKTAEEIDAEKPARRITRLAFLSRFTDAEAVAIDLASIGATVQAASMRRYLSKVNAATYIDLDRADTRAGVQALEANGLLAAGRALEILDAEIQPQEQFVG